MAMCNNGRDYTTPRRIVRGSNGPLCYPEPVESKDQNCSSETEVSPIYSIQDVCGLKEIAGK
jgi:hypothetical protein